jgi:hypothetical protein
MDVVTKTIESTIETVESAKSNGEFKLILSTDDLDRDGENLWADEWMEPLPDRIHFDSDHAFQKGMSVPFTVGSAVPSINEHGQLVCEGEYADTPHAQLTRKLATPGPNGEPAHVRHASVSYQEHETKDGRIVRELLNGTFTGVPANTNSVILSSKDASKAAPLTPGARHADPGYLDRDGNPAQGDNGVPRYQLDDKGHADNAASRFAQDADAAKYTDTQRKAILGRIRSAQRRFGEKVAGKSLAFALCKAITGSDDEMPSHDDLVQAVHDAACHLGAECDSEGDDDSDDDDTGTKSFTVEIDGKRGAQTATVRYGTTVLSQGPLAALSLKSFHAQQGVESPQSTGDVAAAAAVKAAAAAPSPADLAAAARRRSLIILTPESET